MLLTSFLRTVSSRGLAASYSSSSLWQSTVLKSTGIIRNFSSDSSDKFPTDPAIEKLFEANREWRNRISAEDPTFFPKLGAGQQPDYLYIGCSDSRVAVNDLMGVVRNVRGDIR